MADVINIVSYVDIWELMEDLSEGERDDIFSILKENFTWGDTNFALVSPFDVINIFEGTKHQKFVQKIQETVPQFAYINLEG